jgi:type II secretory pathway component PulF
MPIYTYKAKKGPKEVMEGEMLAENRDALVSKLTSEGLVPVHIEEKTTGIQKAKPEVRFGKVKYRDLDIFTRQLSSLIRSGITLIRALEVLSKQTQNPYFSWVISEMEKEVRDGRTLSGAMQRFPNIFSSLYANMIRSGEEGGILDKVLEKLAEYGDKNEEIRSKITSALIYPVLLIILGAGTVFVLLTFFMPRLINLFEGLGQRLPIPTQILLTVGSFLQSNWVWILVVVAIVIALLRRRTISEKEKFIVDWVMLRIPVIGEFIRKENVSRFTRSLSLLLKAGLSIFKSIEVIAPTLSSRIYQDRLSFIKDKIVQGASLARSMEEAKEFSPFEVNMIAIGEESGHLEESLFEISQNYERDLEKVLKIVTTLIEPLVIIFIGCVVGFIVFAMLLPIFQINLR